MINPFDDAYFMKEALKEAQYAFDKDEVPVGAVVVANNKIIARGHNLTEQLNDVTAHAEMIAITSAANHLGAKFLNDCTLYVTLEPCTMCAGAIHWARFSKIVIGAMDEKHGFTTKSNAILHPQTEVVTNILAAESKTILQQFFESKRK